jgi:hypothetical protein
MVPDYSLTLQVIRKGLEGPESTKQTAESFHQDGSPAFPEHKREIETRAFVQPPEET